MIRNMIALAALAACATAQADVVYNWTTIETGNVPTFNSRIQFDDAAWLSGRVNYQWNPIVNRVDASAPVDLFSITDGPHPLLLQPERGFAATANDVPSEALRVDVQFLADGGLSGLIRGDNRNLNISLTGEDTWRIIRYTADFPNATICSDINPSGCTATGRWVLDASTIPDGVGQVPEPGILPLMALASVGLGLSLRKRRQ